MRKSTTKMLSLILAFLMAFSSLSMPAVAAPVDGVDAAYEEIAATGTEVLAETKSDADKDVVIESESVDVNDVSIEADENSVTEDAADENEAADEVVEEEVSKEAELTEKVNVAEEAMQGLIAVSNSALTAYDTSYRTKTYNGDDELMDVYPVCMTFSYDRFNGLIGISSVKVDGKKLNEGAEYGRFYSQSGSMIPYTSEKSFYNFTLGFFGEYSGKHKVEVTISKSIEQINQETGEYGFSDPVDTWSLAKEINFCGPVDYECIPFILNGSHEVDYTQNNEPQVEMSFAINSEIKKIEFVNRQRSVEVGAELTGTVRNYYAGEYKPLTHTDGDATCEFGVRGVGLYGYANYIIDATNVRSGEYYPRITTSDGEVYSFEDWKIDVVSESTDGFVDMDGIYGYTVPDVKITSEGKGDFYFLAYKPVSETGANYKPTNVRVIIDDKEIKESWPYSSNSCFLRKWTTYNGVSVTQVRLVNIAPGVHTYEVIAEDETERVPNCRAKGSFNVAETELVCETEKEIESPYVVGADESGNPKWLYLNFKQIIQESADSYVYNDKVIVNSIVFKESGTENRVEYNVAGSDRGYAEAWGQRIPLYNDVSIDYNGESISVNKYVFLDENTHINTNEFNYNIGIKPLSELDDDKVYDIEFNVIHSFNKDGFENSEEMTYTLKNALRKVSSGIKVYGPYVVPTTSHYLVNSSSDYIAVEVYTKNFDLLAGKTPKLYVDKELTEVAAEYDDTNGSGCYISPVASGYKTYKLKKTDKFKANPTSTLYGSFGEGVYIMSYDAYVTSTGVTALKLDNAVGGIIYKTIFSNKPTKICRLYISDEYRSYIEANNNALDMTVTVYIKYGSVYRNEIINATVKVVEDAEGRLYAEIPANSELYAKMAASFDSKIHIDLGTTVYETYINPVTIDNSTNVNVQSGTYRIIDSFDMGNELISLRQANTRLSNDELDMLSKYPSVILEITDKGEVYTRQVKFVSPYKDSLVYELGNDAVNASGNPEFVFKGETVDSLADPTRAHYTFEGWYYDMAYTKPVVFPIKGLGGKQKTLYAKWKANEYTVSMYTISHNNGEMSTQSETISVIWGETFYLRLKDNTELVKDGYKVDKFIGEHGKVYSADEPVTIEKFENDGNLNNDRVSLQINTSPIDYTITYDLNGAPGSYDEYITPEYKTSYTINDPEYTVSDPVKTDVAGMTFDGWYSDSSLTKAVSKIGGKKLDNITLFAKWVPKTYTLKFDVDLSSYPGAKVTSTKTIPSVEHRVGETFVLPANVFALAPSDSTIKNKYVFEGWSVKKDKNAADPMADKSLVCIDDDILEGKDEITLYAHFAVTNTDTYEIKYDLDLPDIIEGTSKLKEQVKWSADDEYTYGVAKKLSAVPSIPGYDFAGWINTANGKKVTSITAKDMGDIFLKATWKERTYKVVVDGNGAKQKNINWTVKFTDHYNYFGQKDVFTKDGYHFKCWELYLPDGNIKTTNLWDSVVGTAALDETIGQLKNGSKLTYKVNWKIAPYRLQFKTNGAEAIEDMDYTYSTSAIELPVPEKAGYTFLGWATDEACKKVIAKYNTKTKKVLLPAKTFGVETLYAVWECNYSIVFHSADGTKEKKVSGFKVGVSKPLPANPFGTKYKRVIANTGGIVGEYIFTGWKVGSKRAYEKYPDKATIDGSDLNETNLVDGEYVLHLYAGETQHYNDRYYNNEKYTVHFNGISGENFYPTGNMKQVTGTVGKVLKLPKSNIKVDTAILIGWTTIPKLTFDEKDVMFKDGGEFFNMTGGNMYSDIYLYPVWKQNFNIELNVNAPDGYGKYSNYSYTYGTSIDADTFASITAPSRSGYDFAGWYTDAACKKAFKNITKTTSGDFTLYAKWTPKKYTVKYISDAPGTTGKVKDQTVTYGTSVKLSKNTFARVGYQFAGWKKGDSIIEYTSASVYPDNGVMTLVATWTPVKSTITYKNAEYCTLNNDTEFDSPEGYVLKTPVKPGYAFKGWYSDAKCTRKVTEYAPGKPGKYTVYAKWELNTK